MPRPTQRSADGRKSLMYLYPLTVKKEVHGLYCKHAETPHLDFSHEPIKYNAFITAWNDRASHIKVVFALLCLTVEP
jgi:hypothetical protein